VEGNACCVERVDIRQRFMGPVVVCWCVSFEQESFDSSSLCCGTACVSPLACCVLVMPHVFVSFLFAFCKNAVCLAAALWY